MIFFLLETTSSLYFLNGDILISLPESSGSLYIATHPTIQAGVWPAAEGVICEVPRGTGTALLYERCHSHQRGGVGVHQKRVGARHEIVGAASVPTGFQATLIDRDHHNIQIQIRGFKLEKTFFARFLSGKINIYLQYQKI